MLASAVSFTFIVELFSHISLANSVVMACPFTTTAKHHSSSMLGSNSCMSSSYSKAFPETLNWAMVKASSLEEAVTTVDLIELRVKVILYSLFSRNFGCSITSGVLKISLLVSLGLSC